MNTQAERRIAIYSRKSKFTGKGESIGNQIELCREYLRTHHSGPDAEKTLIYEDEGFSGGTLERPHFKEMMADAREGKISTVIVYRLDRISRNIGDFAGLIEQLHDLNISFISMKEQFDTESPMGRAMMYIASVFSQLERETTAERIRDNLHELAKTGRWLGGMTPTGYASEEVKRVSVDGKIRKACRLKLVPEEAALVKLIFEKFLETRSLTGTDTFLLQNGYVTKKGNAFTRFAVKGILTNPVYLIADREAFRYLTENEVDLFASEEEFDGSQGIMAYNRTLQKTGKAGKLRPMKEWIVSVGKHPGLISGALWIQAQRLLNANRTKGYRRPRSHVALLSGLLYCGNCGGAMRPKLTQRCTPAGEGIYSYVCTMKERSRSLRCKIPNVNGNQLDGMLLEKMRSLPENESVWISRLEQIKKELAGNRADDDAKIALLREAADGNEKEIRGLVDSLSRASGTPAEPYIVAKIAELHERGEALKKRLGELRQRTADRKLSETEFDVLRQRLSVFQNCFGEMNVEQKRAVVRACVRKVVWDGEDAHVYLVGSESGCDCPDPPDGETKSSRWGDGTAEEAACEPLGEDSK